MRCKFKLTEIRECYGNNGGKTIIFEPRYDQSIPEDQSFTKWTPSGKLEMFVTNPAVLETVKVGQDYYIDATLIEA